MGLQEQIKEQQAHIKSFQEDIQGIRKEIQKVNDRIKAGKAYGTETADLNKHHARIKQIEEVIKAKCRLIIHLQVSQQQLIF